MGEKNNNIPVTAPTATAVTATVTATPSPTFIESAPTGNETQIKLDGRRGFIPDVQTIETGGEVVWDNFDTITVTLLSSDGLFDPKPLAYFQKHRYVFRQPGTYTFSLANSSLNGTIIVVSQFIPAPSPTVTPNRKLPSNTLYVTARMKTLSNWSTATESKYELNWLKVKIENQQNEPISIKAQILSGDRVLEEKQLSLGNLGSSNEFSNEKYHMINSRNVTLRLFVRNYDPVDYEFVEVDELN